MLKENFFKKSVLKFSCLIFFLTIFLPSITLAEPQSKSNRDIQNQIKKKYATFRGKTFGGLCLLGLSYALYTSARDRYEEAKDYEEHGYPALAENRKEDADFAMAVALVGGLYGIKYIIEGFESRTEAKKLERQLKSQAFLFYQKGKLYVNIPTIGLEHSDSYRIKFPIFAANF